MMAAVAHWYYKVAGINLTWAGRVLCQPVPCGPCSSSGSSSVRLSNRILSSFQQEIVVSVLDFTLDKDCDVCLAHRPLAYRHAMQVGTIKQAFVGWSHPNASHTNPWDERLGWMKAIQDAELIWWPLIRWKSSKTAGFSSFNHSRHRRFR